MNNETKSYSKAFGKRMFVHGVYRIMIGLSSSLKDKLGFKSSIEALTNR